MSRAQNIVDQQYQQQHSNSLQNQRNYKQSANQREQQPLFPNNSMIHSTTRGFLQGTLFIVVGGILMSSIIFSVQSSSDTSNIYTKMELLQNQISDLREGINNKSDKSDYQQLSSNLIKIQGEQMKQDIVKLQDQILSNQNQNTEAKIQYEQMKKDIFKLQDQIMSYQNQNTETKINNEQMKKDIVKLQDQTFSYQNQNTETAKIQLEQIKQDIVKLSEQSKNEQKDIDKNQQDQITDLKNQLILTKDTVSQIVFQQVQTKKDIEPLPLLQQKSIELNTTVGNITKDLDDLKKGTDVVQQLSNNVSILLSEKQRIQLEITALQQLSLKMEGMSVKVDNLKGDMDKVQNQQQTLISPSSPNTSIYNVDNQLSEIKTEITSLKAQIPFAGVLPTIEHYGPYVSNNWIQYIIVIDTVMSLYPTTELCYITVKRKAVITLIATGLATCRWHGQMTFMKDRKQHLQKSGYEQRLHGSQYIAGDWAPINLTQEFYVDEGTYEFTLGMNTISGQHTFEIQSLSFVAKLGIILNKTYFKPNYSPWYG